MRTFLRWRVSAALCLATCSLPAYAALPQYNAVDIAGQYSSGGAPLMPYLLSDNGRYLVAAAQGVSGSTSIIDRQQGNSPVLNGLPVLALDISNQGDVAGVADLVGGQNPRTAACQLNVDTTPASCPINPGDLGVEFTFQELYQLLLPARSQNNVGLYAPLQHLFVGSDPVRDVAGQGPYAADSEIVTPTYGLLETMARISDVADNGLMVGAKVSLSGQAESLTPIIQFYLGGSVFNAGIDSFRTHFLPTEGRISLLPVSISESGVVYMVELDRDIHGHASGVGTTRIYRCTVNPAVVASLTVDSSLSCNEGGLQLVAEIPAPIAALVARVNEAGRMAITGLVDITPEDQQNVDAAYVSFLVDLNDGEVVDLETIVGYSGDLLVASLTESGEVLLNGFNTHPGQFDAAWLLTPTGGGPNSIVVSSNQLLVDPTVDDEFTVHLAVTAEQLYGVEVRCNYDRQVADLYAGTYGDFGLDSLAVPIDSDRNAGTWLGAFSFRAPAEPYTGDFSFATLQFRALPVTGQLDLVCTALGARIDGAPVVMPVGNVQIRVDDGIHGGSASISGVVRYPYGTDHGGIVVTLLLGDRTLVTTTGMDGSYSFSGLRPGAYVVSFSSPRYVGQCLGAVLDGEPVNAAEGRLYAGDTNNDGVIDIADYTFLAARYGTQVGDARYRDRADLNRDGVINVQDLAILGSHFGASNCDPSVFQQTVAFQLSPVVQGAGSGSVTGANATFTVDGEGFVGARLANLLPDHDKRVIGVRFISPGPDVTAAIGVANDTFNPANAVETFAGNAGFLLAGSKSTSEESTSALLNPMAIVPLHERPLANADVLLLFVDNGNWHAVDRSGVELNLGARVGMLSPQFRQIYVGAIAMQPEAIGQTLGVEILGSAATMTAAGIDLSALSAQLPGYRDLMGAPVTTTAP